jgi:hypothetical protein
VAVLAELGTVAVKRAAVQPGHQSLDHDPRDQLEVGDPRKDIRRAGFNSQRSTLKSEI